MATALQRAEPKELAPTDIDVSKVERVAGLALNELELRLETDPESFTPSVLVRVAAEAMKIARSERGGGEEGGRGATTFIQLLAHPGLPLHRRIVVLTDEARRLESEGEDVARVRDKLIEIVGADETERLLAIDVTTTEE